MPHVRGSFKVVILLALVALSLAPGLTGGFIFDDYPNIVDRQAVHATAWDAEQLARAAKAQGTWTNRPLPMLSFGIDHAAAGLDPARYKRVNLLVHLANTLLVLLLARQLLMLARVEGKRAGTAALLLAFLWAVHPLQVSTVYYVVQRMEMMAAGFVLLSLIFYARGRQLQIEGRRAWPWLAASAPAVALGYLCKESALLMPLLALGLELTILRFQASSPTTHRNWKVAYGVLAILALVALVPLWMRYGTPGAFAMRDYDAVERMLTQLRALPMYLGWIIFPNLGSYVFYYDDFAHSASLLQPISTLVGALFLVAMFVAAWLSRARFPLFALGVFWFLGAHAMTSSFLPLELVFEHRNYLALFGTLLALYDLLRRIPFRSEPRLRTLAIASIALGLMSLAAIRSASWGDPLVLAMELAERNPNSSRASMDLGEQYMLRAGVDTSSDFFRLAEQEFERGAAIPGSSPMPEQGLIVMAAATGGEAKPEWWDSILAKLSSRAIGPQEMGMISGLVARRQEGLAIDDDRLSQAYALVAERGKVRPAQIYSFALHATRHTQDKALAHALLTQATLASADQPELVAGMVEVLADEGYVPEARLVAELAERELQISIDWQAAPEASQD